MPNDVMIDQGEGLLGKLLPTGWKKNAPQPNPNHGENMSFLLLVSGLCRVAVYLLISTCATFLPPFDDSSHALSSSFLRWDVFHFVYIAFVGRSSWEHQYAFGQGLPRVMQFTGKIASWIYGQPKYTQHILEAGFLSAFIAGLYSVSALYYLTYYLSGSTSFALLSALLYCMPSSPAALMYAPYTEPFFACFSFQGMIFCVKRRYSLAALCFAMATSFRANGVILVGYLGWDLIAEPFFRGRQISAFRFNLCVVAIAMSISPFVLQQMVGYYTFCIGDPPRPWCSARVPMIYSYVQRHYWNVGFLRYWELSQVPNFIIALPVYVLNLYSSVTGLVFPTRAPCSFLSAPQFRPYALHAAGLTILLLFNSHVQIILRLTSSLPFTYWAAAALLTSKDERKVWWGKAWVVWSIMWGSVTCLLWALYLPPA